MKSLPSRNNDESRFESRLAQIYSIKTNLYFFIPNKSCNFVYVIKYKDMNKEYRYVESNFMGHICYTFVMKAKDLLPIQYVAVRGGSTEQGAVQRVLNKRRINDIKDFVLQGNSFVNSFILNWTDVNNQPKIKKDNIVLPLQGRRVQMLDGQHRIAGIQEAVNIDCKYGDLDVLVSMFIDLKTSDAAKIFLNINSEQKPVPKSLIYDLFGEAVEDSAHVINRVKDHST